MSSKGYKQTKEHKKKISDANKGRIISEEWRDKISKTLTGRKRTYNSKLKQSLSISGDKHHLYGKHHTTESKQKISKTLTGRKRTYNDYKHSEETKIKLRNINLGKKYSEKTKRKLSEMRKGEKHWNWLGGLSFGKYCFKFNAGKKEEI